MANEKKSLGPFQMLGKVFNTVGTVVEAVDNTVSNTSGLMDKAFVGINLPLDNMLADLQCDNIVEDAKRDARIATAQSEAKLIREALDTPKVKRGRPTTTPAK